MSSEILQVVEPDGTADIEMAEPREALLRGGTATSEGAGPRGRTASTGRSNPLRPFKVKDYDILEVWCLRKKLSTRSDGIIKPEERLEFIKFAEEFYIKEREQLLKRVDSAHKVVSSNTSELYQLFGFYIAFHGVIFAASAQTNRLDCKQRWIPVLLSVLASIFILYGVCQKFMVRQREKSHYSDLLARHQHKVFRITDIRENLESPRLVPRITVKGNLEKFLLCFAQQSTTDELVKYLPTILVFFGGALISAMFAVSSVLALCPSLRTDPK